MAAYAQGIHSHWSVYARVCTYVYMYLCMCKCVARIYNMYALYVHNSCSCVHVHTYVCRYLNMNVCMCTYLCVCVHVSVYVCVCTSVSLPVVLFLSQDSPHRSQCNLTIFLLPHLKTFDDSQFLFVETNISKGAEPSLRSPSSLQPS